MKVFTPLAVAAMFSMAPAFAAEQEAPKPVESGPGPMVMTDAQLDQVSAGAPLIDIDVSNVANNVDIVKNVDVNANVAAAVVVLGGRAVAGAAQLPGN
jgi:hypothetical protein